MKISKRTVSAVHIKNGVPGETSRLTAMQELNNVVITFRFILKFCLYKKGDDNG